MSIEIKYCVHCGFVLDEEGNCTNDPRLCEKEDINYCPKCGQVRQQKDVVFCLSCGNTFNDALKKLEEEKERRRLQLEKEEQEQDFERQQKQQSLHENLVETLDSPIVLGIKSISLEKTVAIINSDEKSKIEKEFAQVNSAEIKKAFVDNPLEYLVENRIEDSALPPKKNVTPTISIQQDVNDFISKEHKQDIKAVATLLQKITFGIATVNLFATLYLISIILFSK